jgi:hypothetical protein
VILWTGCGLNIEGSFFMAVSCLEVWLCTIRAPQERAGDLGTAYMIVNHFNSHTHLAELDLVVNVV